MPRLKKKDEFINKQLSTITMNKAVHENTCTESSKGKGFIRVDVVEVIVICFLLIL